MQAKVIAACRVIQPYADQALWTFEHLYLSSELSLIVCETATDILGELLTVQTTIIEDSEISFQKWMANSFAVGVS
ncbi:hypothetical protein KCU73_g3590, partial [Aureobasidium melanogenum]